MSAAAIRFIRKNGHVIPIRAATGAAAVGAKSALRKTPQGAPPLRPNKIAKFASTALAITGGSLAGATFGYGGRAIVGGHIANEAADLASTGLAFGAFAGKGRTKERLEKGADLEIKNQALGWTAYGASALRNPEARARVASYAKKVLGFARKALGVAVE